jgi:hypothetical protein
LSSLVVATLVQRAEHLWDALAHWLALVDLVVKMFLVARLLPQLAAQPHRQQGQHQTCEYQPLPVAQSKYLLEQRARCLGDPLWQARHGRSFLL